MDQDQQRDYSEEQYQDVIELIRASRHDHPKDATYLPLIEARVTRQRDPVRHLQIIGGDLGLFGDVS